MFFSERKKLADKYEKWISENKNILDCPLNVISWLVSEGYLCKTKAVDLEAKLVESEADKKALICDYESRMTKEQELMSWLEHNNEELKQQLAEKEKEKEKEIAILEKALECACSDLQSSGGAYINAQEAVKGNEIILPVENAMQIEYEIALSELDIVKPENMPEKYQNQQSKNILNQDKISFAVEQLEKVKEYIKTNLMSFQKVPIIQEIDNQIKQLKEMK